jgi:hypothetical protein
MWITLGLKKVGNGDILINITLKDGYEIVDLNGGKEEYV